RAGAADNVRQVPIAVQTAEQVDVSQAQVGVEETDGVPCLLQGDGQIEGHAAFADPSLAARDGDRAGVRLGGEVLRDVQLSPPLHHAPQNFRLIVHLSTNTKLDVLENLSPKFLELRT